MNFKQNLNKLICIGCIIVFMIEISEFLLVIYVWIFQLLNINPRPFENLLILGISITLVSVLTLTCVSYIYSFNLGKYWSKLNSYLTIELVAFLVQASLCFVSVVFTWEGFLGDFFAEKQPTFIVGSIAALLFLFATHESSKRLPKI